LAGDAEWHARMPRGVGRGDPAWQAWRDQFRAWCDDRGTDPVDLIRLRRAVKLRQWRAECEAAGETWEGD
jgi:hypothetical protein